MANHLWKGELWTSAGAQNKASRAWSLMLTSAATYFRGILEWPEECQITDKAHVKNTYVYIGTTSSIWSADVPLKDIKQLHWEVGQSYRQVAVWKGTQLPEKGL